MTISMMRENFVLITGLLQAYRLSPRAFDLGSRVLRLETSSKAFSDLWPTLYKYIPSSSKYNIFTVVDNSKDYICVAFNSELQTFRCVCYDIQANYVLQDYVFNATNVFIPTNQALVFYGINYKLGMPYMAKYQFISGFNNPGSNVSQMSDMLRVCPTSDTIMFSKQLCKSESTWQIGAGFVYNGMFLMLSPSGVVMFSEKAFQRPETPYNIETIDFKKFFFCIGYKKDPLSASKYRNFIFYKTFKLNQTLTIITIF